MANEKETGVATGRRPADASRGLVDEAGRVIGSGTERAAEALRRAADDGGSAATGAGGAGGRDAAEETVSAVREGAERASEQARRLMGVSAQDGEAVLAHASRSLDLWVRCGTVFADGAQTLWKEMVSTSRAAVERRMSGLSQATGARTVADLMAVQDRLTREEIDSLLGSGRRMAEISVRIAQDAAERLAENPAGRPRPALPTQDRI
jgi:hypothetical protein